jgi:hypothetical protein
VSPALQKKNGTTLMCQNNARTITLWHDPPETELFSGDTMSNFIGLCTENHETRRK